MEVNNKKTLLILVFKALKCLVAPVSRIRKLLRKTNMRQIKIAAGILITTSCFITLLMYYWHRSSVAEHRTTRPKSKPTSTPEHYIIGTPMRHVPLNEIYKDKSKDDSEDSLQVEDNLQGYILNTPGCQIPLNMVDYERYLKKPKNNGSCGKRAVFLKKIGDDKVQVLIKRRDIRRYLRKSTIFDCCYRFLQISSQFNYENKETPNQTKAKYTVCRKLRDGMFITLESDFINIKCHEYDKRKTPHPIYDDMYAFSKKIQFSKPNHANNCKVKYNVLMLGMDSMSLPRFVKTMPRTVGFFKDNYWLGFRGYHKVGDNTFPNLMSAFTGQNFSTISKRCSGAMDRCNEALIWSSFKKYGYVTAYGEDYLRLPDTFSNDYAFRKFPTDHYLRPFFLKSETEVNNKTLVCAGKSPSGQQLLDFALDYVTTYRENSFFGVFWINSFSHNANSRPQDSDKIFENFFNRLSYTGTLRNTFVIFFSDHGIRFGEHRIKIASYYDERMPILFMWIPIIFKGKETSRFKAAAINQFRLVTPYDLFNTLEEIKQMSICSQFSASVSESCPKCHSLFNVVSSNRTCQDVAIPDKWCSCHKLYPLQVTDTEGVNSVLIVVSYIKSLIKSIKTKRCWGCMSLSLKNIFRIHFYYNNNRTHLYNVVAFAMTPGNVSYEATVLKLDGKSEIVGPISVISTYRGLGKCTIRPKDRLFCVCQKIDSCQNNL